MRKFRKPDINGRSGGGSRYICLRHWMMDSEAWKSLSTNARCLYLEIAKRYYGSNNGRIFYALREATDDLHIGRTAASLAFDQLRDRGFIVAEQEGSFGYKIRHATEWRLTEFENDRTIQVTAKAPTKEFMSWRPGVSFWSRDKNPGPVASITGPHTGPVGSYSVTDVAQNTRHGSHSVTVGRLRRVATGPVA